MIFDRLLRKFMSKPAPAEVPPPQTPYIRPPETTQAVITAIKRHQPVRPGSRQLSVGMWVRWENQTGIITRITYDELALETARLKIPVVVDVMLTDDEGLNKLAIQVRAGEIRQARLEEIPGPRRPAVEIGRRMGY